MRFVPRVPGAKEAMGMAAEKAISPDDLDNPASWGGGGHFISFPCISELTCMSSYYKTLHIINTCEETCQANEELTEMQEKAWQRVNFVCSSAMLV